MKDTYRSTTSRYIAACMMRYIDTINSSIHVMSIKVKNGSYEEPYTEPGAPVHIVSGAAVSSQ